MNYQELSCTLRLIFVLLLCYNYYLMVKKWLNP